MLVDMLKVTFLIHCILTLCAAQSSDERANENIDTLEPIVRSSPEMGSFTDDYFGYTAVLHKLDEDGDMDDVRIVVSAPYGEAAGTVLPRDTNLLATGVIYTCRLAPSDCEGLRGDGNGEDRRLYDIDDNAEVTVVTDGNQGEQKRGQFLGVTLKSTGDTFLTCGHRHLDYGVGLDRNPYGVCYYSGRNLRGFNRYRPCSTSSRSFFGHGQCQAGTSGDIIDRSILVGAPGTFAWRGAVFRRNIAANRNTASDNGVGSGSISWQGYDVVTGRMSSSSNLDFIVSVPRFDNYRGRVNIYANQDTLRPVGNPPLAGEQVGEYYGFSLAAADLQGLGMDDLLVGAPLHSSSSNTPEFGRVYVYRNNRGALSRYAILEGSILYGRFGHAMAKLGDINGDGYEDVAISAPFGLDRDGNTLPGTVYIYAGAGNDVIRQTPIQTIVGNRLNLNLPLPPLLNGSFGASLSSNVDVDNNGYNDLVIGAFRSQRVYVLRTRPVARVRVEIQSEDEVDLTVTSCGDMPCFNITVCLTYETRSGSTQQNTLVSVNYTLQVDPQLIQAGSPNRVNLRVNGQLSGSTTINDSITLTQGVKACSITAQAVVIVNEGEVTSPFTVQFTPTIVDTRMPNDNWNGNMNVNSLDSAPVLFTVGDTVALTQYITSCGNSTCRPDLRVLVMEDGIQYENNDGNVVETMSIVSGVVTSLEIPVLVQNNGDDAFGARITVTYSPALIFSRAAPQNERTITLTCTTMRGTVSSTAQCLIENEFMENATRVLIFRFQTGSITGTEGVLETVFVVTSQPSENATTSGDNRAAVNISTDTDADLMIQVLANPESIVVGQTNPSMITDVAQFAPASSRVEVTFPVSNLGPTRVPSAQVSIFWPLNTPDDDNDNYYLYPILASNGDCEATYINPRELELELLNTESGKRRRRQTVTVTNTTRVSCADGSDSCVEIICNIPVPSISGPLTILAIPDNREFFGTEQNWEFTIYAEVEILGFNDEDATNNNGSVTIVGIPVIAPPSSEDDEIEAWVIIVPIVIGVLVICVIVVALYFLGFFKLKKVDKDKDQVELNQDDAPDGDKPEASEL